MKKIWFVVYNGEERSEFLWPFESKDLAERQIKQVKEYPKSFNVSADRLTISEVEVNSELVYPQP